VLVFPFILSGQAQQKGPVGKAPRYSQVVDRAFQFSEGLGVETAAFQYRVVVRFLPSFSRESQLVFAIEKNHAVRITEFRISGGAPSIYTAYNQELERNPKATLEDILRRISIEEVDRAGGESADQLVAKLFRLSIPTNISVGLCQDGTGYELWIQTPMNQIHTYLSDCSYDERTASVPIMKWLKDTESAYQ
jgi:hypothetical protein